MQPCPNVVVIEDDQDIRDLVRQFLEAEGFSVLTFANGKEAIEGLKNCKNPCLIFLDLMMPIMSGAEFLEARKGYGDRIEKIPVILVSALPDEARLLLRKHGLKGMLRKPIDLDALLTAASQFCSTLSPKAA